MSSEVSHPWSDNNFSPLEIRPCHYSIIIRDRGLASDIVIEYVCHPRSVAVHVHLCLSLHIAQ